MQQGLMVDKEYECIGYKIVEKILKGISHAQDFMLHCIIILFGIVQLAISGID